MKSSHYSEITFAIENKTVLIELRSPLLARILPL